MTLLSCLCLLAMLGAGSALAQSAADGYNPGADNGVRVFAVQADGKVVVGGDFTTIAGVSRSHLARLLPDGQIDPGFADTLVDGSVQSVVIQPDGSIVIGGSFSQVGIYVRNNIARLNADGSVDAAFDPNADGTVDALVAQPDGRLVLGGRSPV